MSSATALPLDELRSVVSHLDAALKVFNQYDGRLTVTDIRLKSMLVTLRSELAQHVSRVERANPPSALD
jgi:hypothetical protein